MTGGAALQGLLPSAAEAAVFATAVFVLNATPGVDFLLTVSRTLAGGLRAGVAAALGIASGCVLHALAAAFGLAALLALHPGAWRVVQAAGVGYLVVLGLGLLRQAWRPATAAAAGRADDPPNPPNPPRAAPERTAGADFRAGLLTNVLNPKVAFFFLAFLPQFVPAGSPSPTLSFLLLGAWFVAQGTAFLLALVGVAARLRRLQARPAVQRALQGLGGLLFIALALRLWRERPAGA